MPNHAVHCWWSNKMLGLECPRTHRLIDSYAQTKGAKHREWFHTPLSASLVAETAEGIHCIPAALNHLLIDRLYDNPDTKILMEMMRLRDREPPQPSGWWSGVTRCKVNRFSNRYT